MAQKYPKMITFWHFSRFWDFVISEISILSLLHILEVPKTTQKRGDFCLIFDPLFDIIFGHFSRSKYPKSVSVSNVRICVGFAITFCVIFVTFLSLFCHFLSFLDPFLTSKPTTFCHFSIAEMNGKSWVFISPFLSIYFESVWHPKYFVERSPFFVIFGPFFDIENDTENDTKKRCFLTPFLTSETDTNFWDFERQNDKKRGAKKRWFLTSKTTQKKRWFLTSKTTWNIAANLTPHDVVSRISTLVLIRGRSRLDIHYIYNTTSTIPMRYKYGPKSEVFWTWREPEIDQKWPFLEYFSVL